MWIHSNRIQIIVTCEQILRKRWIWCWKKTKFYQILPKIKLFDFRYWHKPNHLVQPGESTAVCISHGFQEIVKYFFILQKYTLEQLPWNLDPGNLLWQKEKQHNRKQKFSAESLYMDIVASFYVGRGSLMVWIAFLPQTRPWILDPGRCFLVKFKNNFEKKTQNFCKAL